MEVVYIEETFFLYDFEEKYLLGLFFCLVEVENSMHNDGNVKELTF